MANNLSDFRTASQKTATVKQTDIATYYDRLPVRLRRAMQDAAFNYSAKHIYKLYRELGLEGAIAKIKAHDAKVAAEYHAALLGTAA
ncbi:MAG: hypothetical protein IM664_13035 [Phenylobacterium sp.]|uniref:DUF6525 family protein n=1 Tax=Phenylobacterium sp. TaxID=1871053 RepID=UPI002600D5DE|nr:DUF6525 family protein [Phenylobacterium sp.]MCA6335516.1 hypothetical protein [Phenylobacterium sp.]